MLRILQGLVSAIVRRLFGTYSAVRRGRDLVGKCSGIKGLPPPLSACCPMSIRAAGQAACRVPASISRPFVVVACSSVMLPWRPKWTALFPLATRRTIPPRRGMMGLSGR